MKDLGLLPAVLLVILGSLLTLLAEWVRRRWTRRDAKEDFEQGAELERRRRIEERSEAAAADLLVVFEEVQKAFRGRIRHEDAPDDVALLVARIRRHAAVLVDEEARHRMEAIADAIGSTLEIAYFQGDRPYSVAWTTTKIGRETLSEVLRGEPVSSTRSTLDEYTAAIEAFYEAAAEAEGPAEDG